MQRTRALIATTSAALLISGLGTATARADTPVTDLYVNSSSTACSQTGPGTPAVPFCSVQEAADVVDPGQTVHILHSTQPAAPIVISRSGTADAPITFVGSGFSPDYSRIAAPSGPNTGQVLISVKDAQYVSLDNLTLQSEAETAFRSINSQHIKLDHVDVIGFDSALTPASAPADGVDIDGASSDVVISHSQSQFSSSSAVHVEAGASHVVLASDALVSFGSAINANGVDDLEVAGVTILNVGGGVRVTGASTGSVENTVVVPDFRTGTIGGISLYIATTAGSGVSADYNVVTPNRRGAEYYWGTATYASTSAFQAATGQGLHDVDNPQGLTVVPTEGSPVIDSGDANAPGESSTDYRGHPRADDPLVADTGTGSGDVDRGGMEFQDPFRLAGAVSPAAGPAPLPVAVSATVTDPWGSAVQYSIDFGDGSPAVVSSTASASHTYPTVGGPFSPTITATLRDGTTRLFYVPRVTVKTPGPLVEAVSVGVSFLTATVIENVTSPWLFAGGTVQFGDGSPTVSVPATASAASHTYAAPGAYTITGTESDAGGRTVPFTRQVVVGANYLPVSAARILDTRSGTGAARQPVGPGGVLRLEVAGVGGVPAANVAAVTMNVTDTNATSGSWVVAYPDGTTRPTNESNLNFKAGEANPNLVTVQVGADGYVDLYNANGNVDLIADVQGYYSTVPTGGILDSTFKPTDAWRMLDTRNLAPGSGVTSSPFGSGQAVTTPSFSWAAPGASALVLNITATGADSSGWVAAMPGNGSLPSVSNLNYSPGRTVSNLVVVPVDDSGKFTLYNSSGHVSLIVDIQGYFSASYGGAGYVPLPPTRVADTRVGNHHIGAGSTLRIKVTGTQGVPDGVAAVTVNLTGTGSSKSTYLTAYNGGTRPTVSNLNLTPGQTRPVQAVVPVDAGGYITIYNNTGTVDVIADLEGYYALPQ